MDFLSVNSGASHKSPESDEIVESSEKSPISSLGAKKRFEENDRDLIIELRKGRGERLEGNIEQADDVENHLGVHQLSALRQHTTESTNDGQSAIKQELAKVRDQFKLQRYGK